MVTDLNNIDSKLMNKIEAVKILNLLARLFLQVGTQTI